MTKFHSHFFFHIKKDWWCETGSRACSVKCWAACWWLRLSQLIIRAISIKWEAMSTHLNVKPLNPLKTKNKPMARIINVFLWKITCLLQKSGGGCTGVLFHTCDDHGTTWRSLFPSSIRYSGRQTWQQYLYPLSRPGMACSCVVINL